MKQNTSLFAAAEAAWPEDEAHGTHATFAGRMQDALDDADRAYFRECLARDVAHMHKVFSGESDAAELIRRYDARLADLIAAKVAPVVAAVVPAVAAPAVPTAQHISELWHISRTALAGKSCTRFDRLQYVQRELVREFPTIPAKRLWDAVLSALN